MASVQLSGALAAFLPSSLQPPQTPSGPLLPLDIIAAQQPNASCAADGEDGSSATILATVGQRRARPCVWRRRRVASDAALDLGRSPCLTAPHRTAPPPITLTPPQAIDLVFEAPLMELSEDTPLFNVSLTASLNCPAGLQDRSLSLQATVDAFLDISSAALGCAASSLAADTLTCVPCAAGSFRNSSAAGAACELCPRGAYADGLGQTLCSPCPPGEPRPLGRCPRAAPRCPFACAELIPFFFFCAQARLQIPWGRSSVRRAARARSPTGRAP